MREPENTPAPTRRFLPPSSSSTAKSAGLPSVRRNPFQSSHSTQLPPSSSSFTATPRFQQSTTKVKDDIQTSFDDDTITPALPKGAVSIGTGDMIDVVDDDDYTFSPLYNRAGHTEEGGHPQAGSEASSLQYRQRPFASVNKRRKISHTGAGASEPITISSPLDDDQLDDLSHQIDAESPASQSDLDDDLDLAGKPTATDESARIVRFRPMASDLAQPSPVSRTIFRPVPEDSPLRQSTSGPTLPDMFSPSRRKGRKDYVSGGSADLVRSWVLGIAAQESHAETLSEETLSIVEIWNDSSGRFSIATDENGSRWLLPEQQEKAGTGFRFNSSSLCPGAQILIRGQATRWPLNLGSQSLNNVTVAAYWELISPG